jgi:hypothetical protein
VSASSAAVDIENHSAIIQPNMGDEADSAFAYQFESHQEQLLFDVNEPGFYGVHSLQPEEVHSDYLFAKMLYTFFQILFFHYFQC